MDTIKFSETSKETELISKYSPYFFEVRKRIIVTLSLFAGASVAGFIFYEKIIKFLIEILSLKGVNIVFTSPFQFINLAISCSIATGVIFVIPLIIYQTLSFLRPALKNKEYRMIIRSLPFSIVLFLAGFSFGIIVMKWQIQLFLAKSVELGIGNILDVSRLISTVLLVSVIMGIAFQFPVIMVLLIKVGIISTEYLRKQRLWIYLFSILFPILLPLDSIFADFILALPLIVLFELTLILNRIFKKHKI